MTQQPIFEIVVFKAVDGFTPEDVINASKHIQPFLENYTGYISRQLIHTEDNQWIDFVTWENFEVAHQAAEDIMQLPEAQDFMKVINPESINMMHGKSLFMSSLEQPGI